MTKNLEKAFDLPPIKEAITKQKGEESKTILPTPEKALEKSAKILKALTIAEKVDFALTPVGSIDEHDTEMDDIATEALESYTELKELGMNMADAHSGRMMEVAASMLRTALDARSAKINRKLKTIDLQLKIDLWYNSDVKVKKKIADEIDLIFSDQKEEFKKKYSKSDFVKLVFIYLKLQGEDTNWTAEQLYKNIK